MSGIAAAVFGVCVVVSNLTHHPLELHGCVFVGSNDPTCVDQSTLPEDGQPLVWVVPPGWPPTVLYDADDGGEYAPAWRMWDYKWDEARVHVRLNCPPDLSEFRKDFHP